MELMLRENIGFYNSVRERLVRLADLQGFGTVRFLLGLLGVQTVRELTYEQGLWCMDLIDTALRFEVPKRKGGVSADYIIIDEVNQEERKK